MAIQQMLQTIFGSDVDSLTLIVLLVAFVVLLDRKRARRSPVRSDMDRVQEQTRFRNGGDPRRRSRADCSKREEVFAAIMAMENICGLHANAQYSAVVDAWKELTARKTTFQTPLWSKKYTSKQFYCAVLESHLHLDQPEGLFAVVQHLRTSGFATPTLQIYEDLMRRCAQYKQRSLARKVVDMMYEDGMKPRGVTISCVVSFALLDGEVVTARKFFDALLESGELSVRSCMNGMQVYHAQKDEAAAEALLARMPEWDLEVDHLLLNAAICISVQAGHFEQAEKLLNLYSVKDDDDNKMSVRSLRRFGPTNQLVGWIKNRESDKTRLSF